MWLRPAVPDDAPAVAGVHVRSWQVGYRGLLPGGYLDGLRPEDRAARYHFGAGGPDTSVAGEGGVVRGFATIGPGRGDDESGCGELYALYVDPLAWGHGVGRALLADARRRLAVAGYRQAVLWMLAGNERAARLYRRDGWAPDGARRREEVWGVVVDELRFRRPLP